MYRYLTKFSPFERQGQTRANLVREGAGGGGERGALNNSANFEYSKLGISQRGYKSQNSLRFIRENFSTSITFLRCLYFHGNTFSNYVFSLFLFVFFITWNFFNFIALSYLMPCGLTILRALGPAQYGTLHYLRKDCSKSTKTTRIYRFFKYFLPRHPLNPRNLLLPPVVLVF